MRNCWCTQLQVWKAPVDNAAGNFAQQELKAAVCMNNGPTPPTTPLPLRGGAWVTQVQQFLVQVLQCYTETTHCTNPSTKACNGSQPWQQFILHSSCWSQGCCPQPQDARTDSRLSMSRLDNTQILRGSCCQFACQPCDRCQTGLAVQHSSSGPLSSATWAGRKNTSSTRNTYSPQDSRDLPLARDTRSVCVKASTDKPRSHDR